MKTLVFDRKSKIRVFLSKNLEKEGFKVVSAKNGSIFLNEILNPVVDFLIVCRKELLHYKTEPIYFSQKFNSNLAVYTYDHDGLYINNIELTMPERRSAGKKELNLLKLLLSYKNPDKITDEFIYSLPKKSAILLKHLLLNNTKGITDSEISRLFWGDIGLTKLNNIYGHVYNLRKLLEKRYNKTYVIHREKDSYRLIRAKKSLIS